LNSFRVRRPYQRNRPHTDGTFTNHDQNCTTENKSTSTAAASLYPRCGVPRRHDDIGIMIDPALLSLYIHFKMKTIKYGYGLRVLTARIVGLSYTTECVGREQGVI